MKSTTEKWISISPNFVIDFPVGCEPKLDIDQDSKAVLLALYFKMTKSITVHSFGTLSKKTPLNFDSLQREYETLKIQPGELYNVRVLGTSKIHNNHSTFFVMVETKNSIEVFVSGSHAQSIPKFNKVEYIDP